MFKSQIQNVMQPPSILRTDNKSANLSDLLGLLAAPYFDFSYLLCILFNYSFDLCNYQLLYFLIVKDYKLANYVRVQSVFDVNIIQFQTQTETYFSSFSVILALILNFNAILVQVLNQLILIPIKMSQKWLLLLNYLLNSKSKTAQ